MLSVLIAKGPFLTPREPLCWKPSARIQRNDSKTKRNDADKLELEQWPHVTQFRNWKSTDPRQATEWLAEVDQAKSLQDLENMSEQHSATSR